MRVAIHAHQLSNDLRRGSLTRLVLVVLLRSKGALTRPTDIRDQEGLKGFTRVWKWQGVRLDELV